uniref:NAD(P)-binding domain-containing protein n=1 Tax=Panagrolaimus superbus TaxID=310955 RepID=A0A914YQV5_9BILA
MSAAAPKNVLITGGCGFIGANFVNYIHSAWPNSNFVNIDKLILNSDVNYVSEEVRNSPRYEVCLADIRNRDVISRILESKTIDTIIHFAADCTSTRCYNEPCEAIENNVISYVQFLDTVKDYGKIQKFVHISTDEVYGDSGMESDEIPKSESELMYPGNPFWNSNYFITNQ